MRVPKWANITINPISRLEDTCIKIATEGNTDTYSNAPSSFHDAARAYQITSTFTRESREVREDQKEIEMRTKILYQDIRTRGCTSPDGTRLYVFLQRGQEWFVARKVFICNPAAAIASLAEQGFLVGGAGRVAQLIEQVREVRDFPDQEVLMSSGWNGALFARADGEVLTPTSANDFDVPGVAYVRNPHRNRREGRRSAWLEDIAPAILADQLITTLACSAFAAMTRPFHSLTVPVGDGGEPGLGGTSSNPADGHWQHGLGRPCYRSSGPRCC
jgi:hypothetical protein